MSTVQKINNDYESKRLQRNMTDTQKRNSNYVKEGKIVNSFVLILSTPFSTLKPVYHTCPDLSSPFWGRHGAISPTSSPPRR